MSVHQLPQKTIYADDFQNRVYSFPVDSVVRTESTPERLLVTASEGYMIIDPLTNEPKQALSLPYRKQADGSWAAQGTITLLSSQEEPGAGLVRVQNALAETTILAIQSGQSAAPALERVPPPTLTVSKSAFRFPVTSPGTPKFFVLTVRQQHSNEPVILSSDAPDYFQLASDKHPKFSPTLTLQPAPMGTYVHVRYTADQAGTHHGQLTIRSMYDQQIVTLEGHTTRFLPVRYVQPAYGLPERPAPRQSRKPILIALGAVLLLGLCWLGYTKRASLFPEDAPDAVVNQPASSPQPTSPTVAADKRPVTQQATPPVVRRQTKPKSIRLTTEDPSTPAPEPLEPSSITTASPPFAQTVDKQPEPAPKSANRTERRQANRRTKSRAGEEESELEKVLNQPPPDLP